MSEDRNIKAEILDFVKDLVIILVVVMIIRTFFVLPFQISGQSMYNSYYDREFIIVDRFSYVSRINPPDRWDVVVFNTHITWKEYFIKRIIWLPGDAIKIQSWSVYVKKFWEKDFIELDEKYLDEVNYKKTYVWWSWDEHIFEVPDWEYFVMWDNRNWSSDSRTCFGSCDYWNKTNYVKYNDITWKIFIDLWYFNFRSFSFYQPELWIKTTPKFFNSPWVYEYK